MDIPYSKVDCDGNELKYVSEVLKSGWLTTASKTFELENRFAKIIDTKYACAVNSGTSALHLALEALGVVAGDKVFVPAMTFTATAEVVRYLGADPILLDVEYGSSLISPDILKSAIKKYPSVRFLMIVHYGGQSAQMLGENGINAICQKNNIKIVEDAAHAFPSKNNGTIVGNMGNLSCFSFYANKTITTGEGGMITTDNESIYKRIKTMRLHGINRDIWNRFSDTKASWEYDVVAPGYKYNLPDIAAAVGLAQLERAFEMRNERERCIRFYYENLKDISCITLPLNHGKISENSWHIFQIILSDNAPISRNDMIEKLNSAGIGISVHYKPLYRMTYYKERYSPKLEDFPKSEKIWKGCFSLPLYPSLSNNELEYICKIIHKLLA